MQQFIVLRGKKKEFNYYKNLYFALNQLPLEEDAVCQAGWMRKQAIPLLGWGVKGLLPELCVARAQ